MPIKSHIPANFEHDASIHVRRLASGPFSDANARPQVVMVAGRTVPALVSFDLQSDAAGGGYSWARAIAEAGLDVWIMEVQGMGKSFRPDVMNEKCNILKPDQEKAFGKDNVCAPKYATHLGHSESEWHELNAVVENVKRLTKQSKVILIGYSAGAYVVGPYAMQNPSKVRGLLLLAPIFPPGGPPGPVVGGIQTRPFGPFMIPPISKPEGFYGAPMGVLTKETMPKPNPDTHCPDPQPDKALIDDLWKAMLASETGTFEAGSLSRYPTRYWWGWNDDLVKANPNLGNDIPVLIINGLADGTANQPVTAQNDGRGFFSVPRLYVAISGQRKLMYDIECAGHLIVWQEPYRRKLHKLSIDWLAAFVGYEGGEPSPRDFPFEGTGRFFVPRNGAPTPWNGNVAPQPAPPRRLPSLQQPVPKPGR